MSERKLRQALEMERRWLGRPTYDMHSYDSVRETAWRLGEEALADRPDAAKMLRAIKELELAAGCSCPLTLVYLREETEKAFHIRLTEPSWEWME